MKKCVFIILLFINAQSFSQTIDAWKITAANIDPNNYYGVTVANGMIGIVSSPEPFKVKDVVLAGAYDLYGRGRVSNFLKSFNLLNAYLEIDGRRIDAKNVTGMKQELDMQKASFTTSFDFGDIGSIPIHVDLCSVFSPLYGVFYAFSYFFFAFAILLFHVKMFLRLV